MKTKKRKQTKKRKTNGVDHDTSRYGQYGGAIEQTECGFVYDVSAGYPVSAQVTM